MLAPTLGVAATAKGDSGPLFPESPGSGPPLLHVGANGLGLDNVRLSDLAAAWGPADDIARVPLDRKDGAGGVHHWHYETLGLKFFVAHERARDRDPLVSSVDVRAPFAGRTPNGLYLGMPEAEAMAILERDYRNVSRSPLVWGPYSAERGTWVSVGAPGGSRKSVASFAFRRDRLYEMNFRLAPDPWLSGKSQRELRNLGVLMVVALAAHWVYLRWRPSIDSTWRRMRGSLGAVLVLVGTLLAIMSVQALGGGGWGALGGLVFAGGGLFAVVIGLGLLFAAWRGGRDR